NELGLWSDGQAIHDGSGLSEDNKIATGNLVKGLQIAQHNPKIRPLLEVLPAAASTGTMAIRFADEASTAGRGVVRAKTGSLDRVSALAGYAPTRDGSLVAFALIGNDLPEDQDTRGWFDHVASSLAACNCAAG
ncbi:D-alanyl-D-alanine carboxypeptidase, partial [Propionimicrobium lymphophilum]|uniref:D-alanyl-D-alanine carboxypeptidase n=1 Tax=Propionimicrobium lymphophilum TaxID=33012 RepID=UPI00254E79C2